MLNQSKSNKIKSKIQVVHVLDIFPSKSETFIINFVVETLKYNYSAKILANVVNDIGVSSQQDLLNSTGLYDSAKTFNPQVPENKLRRLFLAIWILLKNLKYFLVFIRTLDSKKYGLKSKTLKMWFQAGVFLNYREVSIFHAHFGKNGKLLAEMKEIGAIKGKVITSFYGYDTFSTKSTRDHFRLYYKGTFQKSHHILTSSGYLQDNLFLLNVPLDKVVVNSVGVNPKLFSYKERRYNGVFNIITVGRLIKLKGQHLGLEVIKLLVERGYNVSYTIIGSGDEYDNLEQKIKNLNLEKVVNLNGGRTQTEIKELLYQNHLFLMTSITDDTGRAEGQGLVIAEAQSTGMPVVGFKSGGIPETIKNGISGFIVEEGNVIAMADAIERFILNTDLINKSGLEGRLFVEKHFNNDIQSQKIIDLYKL
ncbi:glycosyltransferase [Winogradskyella wichelsiae]|uniref:glycosyltransferase n=1 Tax=Winogradskyella wichelsiae TaxID=2697007 RepID=UPI003EF76B56